MLKIKLSRSAEKFLLSIPKKHAQQITRKIDKLAENNGSLPSAEPLEGYPEYSRLKSGEYRIIYRVNEGILTLLVVLIGKRNDGQVYRDFVRIAKKGFNDTQED